MEINKLAPNASAGSESGGNEEQNPRRVRADAQRSTDALLQAALEVFGTSGVDAPVREIAQRAGVGVGTLYRRFPQRSDLVIAVFRHEVDACAEAAPMLAAEYAPGEAVAQWMLRYVDFIAAKRGLAAALHSGDPAFAILPAYFQQRLEPALRSLLDAAAAAGDMRADIAPYDLLRAVANLSTTTQEGGPEHARRMLALLVDGLRYGARPVTGSSKV
ncbi:TetR/AcrR family transcriptional regulator [Undibacterium sp. TJN19]|uniref:TetR/AcrR family transcriptional regulator n=1 Tax=Undibacterium sp. TJN19 TaxID=3413055 RepID=UPI003BF444F6